MTAVFEIVDMPCWLQDVLDLIEKKPLGVLDSLDEACRFPTATGATFAEKLYTNKDVMDHKRFEKPKRSQTAFIIDHYAGKVEYQVTIPCSPAPVYVRGAAA